MNMNTAPPFKPNFLFSTFNQSQTKQYDQSKNRNDAVSKSVPLLQSIETNGTVLHWQIKKFKEKRIKVKSYQRPTLPLPKKL